MSATENPEATYAPYAQAACHVLEINSDANEKTYRNAVATAFVYAVLDLADAIRSREAGR